MRGKNSQIFRERNSGVNESGPGPFYVMGSTLYTFVQDNLSFNLVLTNVHAQNKHKHVQSLNPDEIYPNTVLLAEKNPI